MNLRKRKRANVEMHASAMNDIMFFLMLFFLIAATVTNPNIVPLSLPKSDSGQSLSKKTINVSITKDLEYYVEKQQVQLEQLQATIQAYQKKAQDLTVVLHTEGTVSIQDVVNVMDIGNKLKVKMVLATKAKS
ncbi:MAG TPA: biopolymer transporter ExbD [Sphingobacteriaceae bacterium]|nr:biopolymer transporter ExbD [Sphingobacteriaceae bacterium]